MHNLRIDSDRLWQSLMTMAKIGATDKGGVCRLALTDLDRESRDLFIDWCRSAGCTVTVDKMGNIFARREGSDPALPPIVTGSHLDTQPTGGRFDGAYGVLAGLEVMRTLHENKYTTKAPIEVAMWTNEEGTRFAPSMTGSGVFAGVFDLAYGTSRIDTEGKTIGDELKRIGYAGETAMGNRPFGAFFEAHIEQGPILEAEKKTIGVVVGAQGQRWYEITVTGQEAHAGPTPMKRRRDALLGAARIAVEVNRIGLGQPLACATVGMMNVSPNSRNTIPGHVFLTVDLRHPDNAVLLEMDKRLRGAVAAISQEIRLEAAIQEIWHAPAISFDRACVHAVREAAAELGYPHMDIVSGAGHDACNISRVAPTAMIFVPCEGGISHNEIESASKEDVAAGAQVLLHAILSRADDLHK